MVKRVGQVSRNLADVAGFPLRLQPFLEGPALLVPQPARYFYVEPVGTEPHDAPGRAVRLREFVEPGLDVSAIFVGPRVRRRG